MSSASWVVFRADCLLSLPSSLLCSFVILSWFVLDFSCHAASPDNFFINIFPVSIQLLSGVSAFLMFFGPRLQVSIVINQILLHLFSC